MTKLNDYIEKYRKIHEKIEQPVFFDNTELITEKNFGIYGDGWTLVRRSLPFITEFQIKKQRKIDVLDYGCGKALYYKNSIVDATRGLSKALGNTSFKDYMDARVNTWDLYDPAVANFSTKPVGKQYDLVTNCDVMEHIPEEHVTDVLIDIFSFVKEDGMAVFTITGTPASLFFRDEQKNVGENLHCTQRKIEWWIDKITNASNGRAFGLVYLGEMLRVKTSRVITNTTKHGFDSQHHQIDMNFINNFYDRVAKEGIQNINTI